MEKIKIYAVAGPTASGKSALALELAKRHNGEIISCDSMQIYKKMNIGTAKPTQEELSAVRHHMIDIADPKSAYSCEDYVRDAAAAIEDCAKRGKLPIVCGGTGFYLDALLRGGNAAFVADTSDIRRQLLSRVEKEGIMPIYRELAEIDPESAEAIHPNNEKRVIRAMEIYLSCGKTKTELDRESKSLASPYDASVLVLCYENREILYKRIEKRVDQMLAAGLVEEAKMLKREGVFEVNATAAQAIGYKELMGCLDGKETLESATEHLKTATRRYAKRQMTWFRAKSYAVPLEADCGGRIKTFEEIVNNAEKLFSL